jgi:hypothetical protein
MSSWNTSLPRKRIRLGFHQPVPAGRFQTKETPATVVSAYYPLQKSKYTVDHYNTWLKLFLTNCEAHLVFFTNAETAPFIESCRSNFQEKTKIIILEKSEWVSNTQFSAEFWDNQHAIDRESNIHSPELYKVWFEKKEFVKRAIALNPWNHTDFVWCDAGICRSESFAKLIKQFPVASRIPTDKILLCNVGEYTERDEHIQIINGVPFQGGATGNMRIGGGIVAASIAMWNIYDTIYTSTMNKYIDANLFCGKEQNILETMVLEHRNYISLVSPEKIGPELWFYLALWLCVGENAFKRMNHPSQKNIPMTYEQLAKLDKLH